MHFGNGNLGVVSKLQNHLGGRTPSWDNQHDRRPGVKNNVRSLWLDAKAINFSGHPGATGSTGGRSFASHLTKLLPQFYSWRPDPDAEATDAFTQNWALSRGFANPPWCLINCCLCQVARQQARIVLLTLWWSTQSWFPVVLGMLEDHPHLLPDNPNLVSLPVGHQFILPQGVSQLIAWPISWNPSHHRAFLEKLQNFSFHHGDQRQTRTTIHCVQDGLLGVSQGIEIPLKDL